MKDKDECVKLAFSKCGISEKQMESAMRKWKLLCLSNPEDYSFSTVLRKFRKLP